MSDTRPIEVTLVDERGQEIVRASVDRETAVQQLAAQALSLRPQWEGRTLCCRYAGNELGDRTTMTEVLFGFHPVDGEGVELTVGPVGGESVEEGGRRGRDTGRYYPLKRVLEELEVEYEELAGLVADGKIRAFRVEDTTRFSKADVQTLKAESARRRALTPRSDYDMSLAEALSALGLEEGALARLISTGDLPAFRDGDEVRFRGADVQAHLAARRRRYCALPEVLRMLGVDERALARMVADGVIRAFRDGDEMWFRRSDVDEQIVEVAVGGPDLRPRFFDVDAVQQILAVDERELARMVADGEVRAFRDGDRIRFPRVDVRDALHARGGGHLGRIVLDEAMAAEQLGGPGALEALVAEGALHALPGKASARLFAAVEVERLRRTMIEEDAETEAPAAPVVEESDGHPPVPPAAVMPAVQPITRPPTPQALARRVTVELPLRVRARRTFTMRVRIGRSADRGGRAMVDVTPELSGCLIVPPRGRLDARRGGEVHFAITPLLAGRTSPGCVVIRRVGRDDKSLATLDVPLQVVSGWPSVVALMIGALLPLVTTMLALLRPPGVTDSALANAALGVVSAVGGWDVVGLGGGLIALGVAASLRVLSRPLEGPPLTAQLHVPLAGSGQRAPGAVIAPARDRRSAPAEVIPAVPGPESWAGCVALGVNVQGLRRFRHVRTGIALVEVPVGPFWMGAADSEPGAGADERPQRRIELPTFLIGEVPVTVGQYRAFAGEVPEWGPNAELDVALADAGYLRGWGRGEAQRTHPVTRVSWPAASAFCEWAGLVLPGEAHWEKAARGTHGARYPWGDDPPTRIHARYVDIRPAPVWDAGRYAGFHAAGASPFGVLEMAGNVAEWVDDWYDALAYQASEAPADGRYKVIRGGSYQAPASALRATARQCRPPETCEASLGFRVALFAEESS